MAVRYYDDAIIQKLQRWIPEESNLRILKPDESKRLFELTANDNNDRPITLPLIALSRSNDIELLSNIKQSRSFDGLRIAKKGDGVAQFNVIPIKLLYQLDIYTKYEEECEEYLRNLLFKLINNPVIKIEIPYNNAEIEHIANIRVLNNVSDTSSTSERLFSGQFTRWSIQLEIQDAFLFSIPYKPTWKIIEVDLEPSNKINGPGEEEFVYRFSKPI